MGWKLYFLTDTRRKLKNTFISDLAVACVTQSQIKTSSMSRSDRVAKYDQLLRIEENFQRKKTLKINKFVHNFFIYCVEQKVGPNQIFLRFLNKLTSFKFVSIKQM